MPTLIKELSIQQRSWMYETFGNYGDDELSSGEGSSDDLESHYIKRHRNNETSTPVRRNSNDDSINYNEPSPTPYIDIPPFSMSSTTDLPPIPCGVESHDNRNSIFRRSIGSTNTTTTNDASSGDGDGEGHPSPISNHDQPHPGSIWSPLHDKAIITTPPTVDHPVYGNTSSRSSNYPYGPHSSSPPDHTGPNSFLMLPRPPFTRSVNHPIKPSVGTAILTGRVAAAIATTTNVAPIFHPAMNDDMTYYFHHHHHYPLPPPLPHYPHQHHPYTMRPIQHHHKHPSVTSVQKNVTVPENTHKHRISHTDNQTHHNCSTKQAVFPNSDDKLTWLQSFENLKIYKRLYGDCNVPQKYKMNVKLGGWVNKQRKKKKNPSKYGKLSDDQIAQMEEIGFKWIVESIQET